VLESFSFTAVKLAMVQGVIDERVKELTDEHVRCVPRQPLTPFGLNGFEFL